jgi:uncharacterized protein YecT (DUF1311 family)
MLSKPLLLALALSTLALPASSFAGDNCDTPRDDFDGFYCLNKVYAEADRDLNKSYKELASQLDKSGRATLKKRQLAWIASRNDQCIFKKDGDTYLSMGCATRMTIERTNALNDRVRECKATGCQPSQL